MGIGEWGIVNWERGIGEWGIGVASNLRIASVGKALRSQGEREN
jgi:hypothetical protein